MAVSTDVVKHLRQLTGSSIGLCKKALEATDGNIERALTLLKKSSESLAGKKTERMTKAGIIESYVHGNRKIGVLLELRCETDFVARNPEFQALAHDIALHIAGTSPLYIRHDAIPPEAYQEAERLFSEEAEQLGKSQEMTKKIVQGKLETHFRETSLLSQPFVKDPSMTIGALIQQRIAHFGENITIERFVRFEV